MHVVAACVDIPPTQLEGFVISTSSIGCVGAESNAQVYFNAGEPTRPWTSGIDYFGSKDVESSTSDPSVQVVL